MPIRARKTFKVGPRLLCVRFNFTQGGFTSWSVQVGPWSWNARTRRQSVDLPGPLRWQSAAPKRKPKGGRP